MTTLLDKDDHFGGLEKVHFTGHSDDHISYMMRHRQMATLFNGQRRLLDAETGEIIDAQVVTKTVGDAGFHKIWLAEILELVDEVGNAKMKILMWLLSKTNHQNQVVATHQEIADATDTSPKTVQRLMRSLKSAMVIVEVRRSHWRLNPDVIFKGDHRQRMNVLIKYRTESAQADMFDLEAKRAAKKGAA